MAINVVDPGDRVSFRAGTPEGPHIRCKHVEILPPPKRWQAARAKSIGPSEGVQGSVRRQDPAQPDLLSRRQALVAGAAMTAACSSNAQPAKAAECSLMPGTEEGNTVASGQVERDYDSYSETYDALDDGVLAKQLGITALRRELIALAYGDVLEVGVGTGLNLPLYQKGQVQHLTGLDLSAGMLKQAVSRIRDIGAEDWVELCKGDVAALPFADASFDCVVDTYSLCVFQQPASALAEMARVVKPSGQLLLVEHSRSDFGVLALYQDVTAHAVVATGKGCVWNQDLKSLLKESGLIIKKQKMALGGLVRLVVAQRA